jgi:tetraprenyl-beta-curcumene synthase
LTAAAARQLAWGSRVTAKQVRAWRARARAIPDTPIRRDALDSLAHKRGHIEGAALFSIIPHARSKDLVRLLVAYQILFDFLDGVNERSASAINGVQMHLALVDALDPGSPRADYLAHHPWRNDGGYLATLVEVCRAMCRRLPGYPWVRELVLGEAHALNVLALNHIPNSAAREAALRGWCRGVACGARDITWYELAAGGSSSLAIHTLLALASDPGCARMDLSDVRRRYARVISVMGTMLDSYADQIEDAGNGDHSYVAYYPTPRVRLARLQTLIRRSLEEALLLPDGERHALIVACMVAMYLSKDSSRSHRLHSSSASLAAAGGSLTGLLVPALRMWRIAYAQRGS